MNRKTAVVPALVFASAAALTLAACESSGNYRVGWVGDTPPPGGSASSSSGGDGGSSSGGSSGGTASSGGSGGSGGSSGSSGGTASSGGTGATGLVGNLIVTAGNTVIGAAGKTDNVVRGGVLPTAGVVTATVTGVLAKTGQTLVKIGQGTGGSGGGGLILDGVGGKVGALVGIDLGKGQVIAAPEGSKSLIGLNVLAKSPDTGKLATVSALSGGGKLLSVDVNKTTGGLVGGDKGLLGGVIGAVGGVTGGVTGGDKGVLSGVTGAVGNVTGGLTGKATGEAGGLLAPVVAPTPQGGGVIGTTTGAVKSTVGTVGGVVGGVTGGLLGGKKHK